MALKLRPLPLHLGLAVLLLLLAACATNVVVKPRALVPVQLPGILEKAQKELDAGKPLSAFVLLKNNQDGSAEKQALLQKVQQKLIDQWTTAKKAQPTRTLTDLEKTLDLANLLPPGSQDAVQTSVPDLKASPGTPEDWLKGTVTVLVNRGLKFDHGLSVPDQVLGSGFFISDDGYLLTNHHVIDSLVDPDFKGSAKLSIRLPDSRGERLPAKVIGWDSNHDLALLKTEYHPQYVFHFSQNATLKAGQRLLALGSPGGLEATLTQGIVSAVSRPFLPMGEVLQIDVAVNPGNSGGPLLESDGSVVGIVFAGIQQFQGVNFAIPGETVRKMVPRLREGGRSILPWIGIGLQEDVLGLEVIYITPQSPGDWAGLKLGDRLTAVAGVPVNEIASIQDLLLDYGTNAALPLDIRRGKDTLRLWTTLAERPDEPLKLAADQDLIGNILPLAFGMTVEDVGTPVDKTFRVKRVFSGTDAEDLGLSENDPLIVQDWTVDKENKALILRALIKRRLGGYIESMVQLYTALTGRQMI